ncbi:MAG TPA: 2-C-methyl-D-erythritol 4-phosphate cytidylyltransferase [Longimicrobiales bacterium]|nr:2-C-methyl-D-erythritol 4-phosphate cytidylyltransferase [Longimicrobiales bacterium]
MSGARPVETVRVGVAVPAAGSGQRMGGARKPFLELAGEPVLLRSLRPFLADPRVVAVVVALAEPDAAAPPAWLTGLDPRIRVVRGGDTRAESVRRALAALPEDVDVVAVHDAARPLVTEEVVARCIDVAAAGEGAVAGCPAVDTVKEVDGEGRVVATPDRRRIWHAHTPQVFPAGALRRAYQGDLAGATDDASLVERGALTVRMVDGGAANLKVTRAADLALAEAILRTREGR